MITGYCPICRWRRVYLTRHHKWKKAVWRDKKKRNKTIMLCRECHDELEKEITRRENEILRQHPEIYIGTLNEFIAHGLPQRG